MALPAHTFRHIHKHNIRSIHKLPVRAQMYIAAAGAADSAECVPIAGDTATRYPTLEYCIGEYGRIQMEIVVLKIVRFLHRLPLFY